MAANPLPLLALAGAAFYLMKGKESGSATPNGEPTTLRILGPNCQPLPEPANEAEAKKYATDIQGYIQKRVPELYQKFMAQGYLWGRLNLPPLTDAMKAHLEGSGEPIQFKDGYILAPLDQPEEIYAALYEELVPPSCAMKLIWDESLGRFQDAIYPSPTASCAAATLRVQTSVILVSVTGDDSLKLTPEQILETVSACTGLAL